MWCGSDESIDTYNNEPRCGTCRELEATISEARSFLGMYGLRPLGGSLDSEDEEERDIRVRARDARAELNAVRLADPPTREQIRKALSGHRSTAVERVEAADTAAAPSGADAAGTKTSGTSTPGARTSSASRTASTDRKGRTADKSASRSRPTGGASRTAASPAKDVDLETLESRVTTLLDKMASIDALIAENAESKGLAAQARAKDLDRQRTSVLHTLAALEKARRLQSG